MADKIMVHKCLLCGKTFTGWGNNPEPLVRPEDIKSGKEITCCDACNSAKVIPARMKNFIGNFYKG